MFQKNIKYLRAKNKITQAEIAKKIGLTSSAVSQWERHRTANMKKAPIPPLDVLIKLVDVLHAPSVEALLTVDLEREDGKVQEPKQYTSIKVYGSIPAGVPNDMWGEPISEEDIPKDWERGGKEYFGLKVKGDSMYPKYMDGDIVIARKQDTFESGNDCIVSVNGYEATFKKVIRQGSAVILQPINTSYEPQIFTGAEDEPDIRILGVVVELRRTINQ